MGAASSSGARTPSMFRYAIRRLLESVLLMLGVLVLVFFLVRLTGDPVSLIVPMDAPTEQREAFRELMGLNAPLAVQFWGFMSGAVQGDFGNSLRRRGEANLFAIGIHLLTDLAYGLLDPRLRRA